MTSLLATWNHRRQPHWRATDLNERSTPVTSAVGKNPTHNGPHFALFFFWHGRVEEAGDFKDPRCIGPCTPTQTRWRATCPLLRMATVAGSLDTLYCITTCFNSRRNSTSQPRRHWDPCAIGPLYSRHLQSARLSTATMLSMLQNPRQAAAQVLNFALILSSAFMVPPTTA